MFCVLVIFEVFWGISRVIFCSPGRTPRPQNGRHFNERFPTKCQKRDLQIGSQHAPLIMKRDSGSNMWQDITTPHTKCLWHSWEHEHSLSSTFIYKPPPPTPPTPTPPQTHTPSSHPNALSLKADQRQLSIHSISWWIPPTVKMTQCCLDGCVCVCVCVRIYVCLCLCASGCVGVCVCFVSEIGSFQCTHCVYLLGSHCGATHTHTHTHTAA